MAGDLELLEKRLKLIGWLAGGLFGFVATTGLPPLVAGRLGLPSALANLFFGVLFLAFAAAFVHNWEFLGAGAEPAGGKAREKFARLRESLETFSHAEDFYAKSLTKFLDWVDWFFDVAQVKKVTGAAPEKTQRGFFLKEPAYLWTAPSYDRCLLLALIYPVLSIYVVWLLTGEVGPAEKALFMRSADIDTRLVSAIGLTLILPIALRYYKSRGTHKIIFIMIFFINFTLNIIFSIAVSGVLSFIISFYSARLITRNIFGAIVYFVIGIMLCEFMRGKDFYTNIYLNTILITVALPSISVGISAMIAVTEGNSCLSGIRSFLAANCFSFFIGVLLYTPYVIAPLNAPVIALYYKIVLVVPSVLLKLSLLSSLIIFAAAFVGGVSFAVGQGQNAAIRSHVQSYVQAGFALAAFATNFVVAQYFYIVGIPFWDFVGMVTLFFSLLPLVNAPFDWASIGLTRFLLRLGLQIGGRWPYWLALIDAALASVLIFLLPMTMVFAVDLFDHLAASGGGDKARLLPPMVFYLSMLRQNPSDHEFWWIYSTLFSTMIPSVINLFLAGFSFLRGLAWTRKFLLDNMVLGETMPPGPRLACALILTLEKAVALVLALAAQAFLGWVILWQALPRLGWGALEAAEWAAGFFS